MHLESILNRVERHTWFVSKQVRFVDGVVEWGLAHRNLSGTDTSHTGFSRVASAPQPAGGMLGAGGM
jgi:hypothetical protein